MCNTSNKTTQDIIIYDLQTFDIKCLLFVYLIKPTFSYDLFPKQKEEKLPEKNNQGYNHDSTMKVSSFIFTLMSWSTTPHKFSPLFEPSQVSLSYTQSVKKLNLRRILTFKSLTMMAYWSRAAISKCFDVWQDNVPPLGRYWVIMVQISLLASCLYVQKILSHTIIGLSLMIEVAEDVKM